MKLTILAILFVLVLSFNVFAADLSADVMSVSPGSVNPGSSLTLNLNLTNAGTDDITPVSITTTDATNTATSARLTLPDTLDAGLTVQAASSMERSVNFLIPTNAPAGTYTATLTARDTDDATETDSDDYTFTITAVPALTVLRNSDVVSDSLSLSAESGEDQNVLRLTLRNDGNVVLRNIQARAEFSDLEDNDGDSITVEQPSSIASLGIGSTATLDFNFDVDSGFDSETLTGNLVLDSDEFDREITLSVRVAPIACLPSADDSDIRLDIQSPDDNDDFDLGDDLEVELDVDNRAEDDMDVKLEAVLYNTDRDRRVDSYTVRRNIDEDESDSFTFTLTLDDNARDNDEYTLFVKAFDEDNDEETCVMEEIDIDVQVPDNKITINSPTLVPSSASCSERVSGSVSLRNVGQEDETVSFEIYNTQLGISQSAQQFELNEDDSQVVNFGFNLPNNAQAGLYPIYFRARYNGEETLSVQQLTVTQCNQGASDRSSSSGSSSGSNTNQGSSSSSGFTQTGSSGSSFPTGNVVLTEKDLFEKFNTPGFKVPSLVWILIDVLLGLLIIACLVWLFRSN